MLVEFRVATWGAQPQSGLGQGSSSQRLSRLSLELQSLCKQGQLDRALDVLLRVDNQDLVPSVNDYRILLKACTKKKDLVQAKHVHAHLTQHGLESATLLGEDVVSTLVKCGGFEEALQVFHRLTHRNTFCWTAIISGYANGGQGQKALRMYLLMQEEDVKPNEYTFISLLKACGTIADLEAGKCIHDEVLKYGYQRDLYVCTSLVDMYGKCRSIVDAQNVFNELAQPDVVSWNAMLAAYVEQGQAEKTIQLYEQMTKRGVNPSNRTFLSVVQACGILADKEEAVIVDGRCSKIESLKRGEAIHADVHRKGYGSDVFVANTLISMYGKCGSIENAHNVFIGLSQRNVITWNVMLGAFVEQGQAKRALQLFEQMQRDGLSLTSRTFVGVLQACGMLADEEEGVMVEGGCIKSESLKRGEAIHAEARKKGYDSDAFVANTLVVMYGKCGAILDAQTVFDRLSHRDVVSWNALLMAYVEQGQAEKVLQLYEQMHEEYVIPDSRTFVSTLQACGMLADKEDDTIVDGQSTKVMSLKKGGAIHAHARRERYHLDVFVGSALVSMYGKCGSIRDAQNVFGDLPRRDVVSWNTMLAAYVEKGHAEEALHLFRCMQEEGIKPDKRTFVSALQACAMVADKEQDVMVDGQSTKVQSLKMGEAIHVDVLRRKCDSDVFVANTLISMYGKCGSIVNAKRVFDGLPQRDVVSWNVMVAVYVEHGQPEKALQLYEEMLKEEVSPDNWTFTSMLQACGLLANKEEDVIVDGCLTKVQSLKTGKRIHADARKQGYDTDAFVGSTLVIMYGKCGSIANAEIVFNGLSQCDVVAWNSMLAAYVEEGNAEKALQLYSRMKDEGPSLDSRTFVSALQACGMLADKEEEVMLGGQATKVRSLKMVEEIHKDSLTKNYNTDFFVCNTLISVYGKCGSIGNAQHAFDVVSQHDVVTWTALVTAYVDQGQVETGLQLYRQMQEEGVSPNDVTTVCILQACGKGGSLGTLQQIHQSLVSKGDNLSPLLANSLISAYGRCSRMVDAQAVFDSLAQPDTVSWTALIAAYARQGNHVATLQCYEKMQLAGANPNKVTFLAVLTACSHAGLVEKGVKYFESMSRDHGISPEVEHYGTMVDLLGRAGLFSEVEDLLSRMPMPPDLAMWSCLLGACQKHGKLMLGKWAFNCAVHLQPKHPAAYVLMSNIYADAGLWDLAKEVRELRQRASAWKKPGQSWIEHERKVHSFVVGNYADEKLYGLIRELNGALQLAGYFLVDNEEQDAGQSRGSQ